MIASPCGWEQIKLTRRSATDLLSDVARLQPPRRYILWLYPCLLVFLYQWDVCVKCAGTRNVPDFYLQTGRDHRDLDLATLSWNGGKIHCGAFFLFCFWKRKNEMVENNRYIYAAMFFFSVCWTKSLERQCRSESKYKYHNDKLLTREQLQNVLVGTDFALILSGRLIKTPARISIGRRKST